MKKVMMALRDKKADLFMNPFFVPMPGVAFRNLQDEVARGGEDNVLSKHPGDFEVWSIGLFDEQTGVLTSEPKLICEVQDLVAK